MELLEPRSWGVEALFMENEAFCARERAREELDKCIKRQVNLDSCITRLDMEIYGLRNAMSGGASARLIEEKEQDRKFDLRERNNERSRKPRLEANLKHCIEIYNVASDNAYPVQYRYFMIVANHIDNSQIRLAMQKKAERSLSRYPKRLSLYIDYEFTLHLLVNKPTELIRDGSDCWQIKVTPNWCISLRKDRSQEDAYAERLAWTLVGWNPPFAVRF